MANWEGINEFVAVVETESFTAASKRLGISTAQVSRQISTLEQRLATKLFYRTTRRVTVTDAGQLFYQHTRPLLDGVEEAESALNSLQSNPRGKLKLTAPVAFGEQHITPVISQYCLEYPDLNVEMMLTNLQVDLVDEGVDLAIRLGQLADSNMMAKRLGSRTLHLCAAPSYLERSGEPHSLSELANHNCLLGTLDYWRFNNNNRTTPLKVSGSLRCNSGQALLDMALAGVGLVQLPSNYVSQPLQTGELVELMTQFRPPEEGIWALYPHNRQLSPKVSLLIDRLKQALSEP